MKPFPRSSGVPAGIISAQTYTLPTAAGPFLKATRGNCGLGEFRISDCGFRIVDCVGIVSSTGKWGIEFACRRIVARGVFPFASGFTRGLFQSLQTNHSRIHGTRGRHKWSVPHVWIAWGNPPVKPGANGKTQVKTSFRSGLPIRPGFHPRDSLRYSISRCVENPIRLSCTTRRSGLTWVGLGRYDGGFV